MVVACIVWFVMHRLRISYCSGCRSSRFGCEFPFLRRMSPNNSTRSTIRTISADRDRTACNSCRFVHLLPISRCTGIHNRRRRPVSCTRHSHHKWLPEEHNMSTCSHRVCRAINAAARERRYQHSLRYFIGNDIMRWNLQIFVELCLGRVRSRERDMAGQ